MKIGTIINRVLLATSLLAIGIVNPVFVAVILFVAAVAFAPTLLAFHRRHHQKYAILILNNVALSLALLMEFGTGMTPWPVFCLICFGWIGALVWVATAVQRQDNVPALVGAVAVSMN